MPLGFSEIQNPLLLTQDPERFYQGGENKYVLSSFLRQKRCFVYQKENVFEKGMFLPGRERSLENKRQHLWEIK